MGLPPRTLALPHRLDRKTSGLVLAAPCRPLDGRHEAPALAAALELLATPPPADPHWDASIDERGAAHGCGKSLGGLGVVKTYLARVHGAFPRSAEDAEATALSMSRRKGEGGAEIRIDWVPTLSRGLASGLGPSFNSIFNLAPRLPPEMKGVAPVSPRDEGWLCVSAAVGMAVFKLKRRGITSDGKHATSLFKFISKGPLFALMKPRANLKRVLLAS